MSRADTSPKRFGEQQPQASSENEGMKFDSVIDAANYLGEAHTMATKPFAINQIIRCPVYT
jgi:predicted LPLAT superfamily acyltransferase